MKEKIKTSLENIMKELFPFQAILGAQVISVDIDKAICKVKLTNSELELEEVRIRSVADDSTMGLIAYPAINSKVLVGFINNTLSEAFIIKTSELSELRLKGDEFGGLIKIEELKTQVDKNSEILQGLLDIFTGSPINEPGNGAPSALQTALGLILQNKEVADLSDIENENVKHG